MGVKLVEVSKMSTAKRNWAVDVYAGFYWIGIAMTLGCWAFILAGNTETLWRFEHRGFPLSWAFAGAAALAFLAAEFCHCTFSLSSEAEDRSSPPSPEWETAESIG